MRIWQIHTLLTPTRQKQKLSSTLLWLLLHLQEGVGMQQQQQHQWEVFCLMLGVEQQQLQSLQLH
jgi:hypothetical protein